MESQLSFNNLASKASVVAPGLYLGRKLASALSGSTVSSGDTFVASVKSEKERPAFEARTIDYSRFVNQFKFSIFDSQYKYFCRVTSERDKTPKFYSRSREVSPKEAIDSVEKYDHLMCAVGWKSVVLTPELQAEVLNIGKSLFSIDETVKRLEKKFGVKISVDGGKCDGYKETKITCAREMNNKLHELEREMDKYPPGFFKKNPVNEIILHSKLVGEHSEVGGLYNSQNNTIHLINPKWAFCHEMHHRLDLRDSRELKAANIIAHERYVDDKSPYLNAHERGSYDGDKGHQWYSTCPHCINPLGFANSYGMVNPKEDEATIAESLFRKPGEFHEEADSAIIHERIQTDETLARKVAITKNDYDFWSGGAMGKEFFDDIRNGKKIDGDYWAKKLPKNLPEKSIFSIFSNAIIFARSPGIY